MIRRIVLLPVMSLLVPQLASAQAVRCNQDSVSALRGETGCRIIAVKRLPIPMPSPVLWHIDEFQSMAAAQRAESPTSMAVSAFGSAWLYTIEGDTSQHHGGKHRGVVGPIPIQQGHAYSMVAISAYFLPGQVSVVHTHHGPEAWWVLEGEQCLQTTRTTIRARAGQGAIVAEGDTMRMVGTGTGPRRVLALILNDAANPGNGLMLDDALPMKSCD
jgi:quercetin dioxygenase-like cupin family protein